MSSVLKKYFPMIRERQNVLDEINSRPDLLEKFNLWTDDERETFLKYCTGERGLKITYDQYFKEVFNPDYTTERLNDMLSCIMGQKVTIINVLSNEGARIASEKSLLMTDILVQLENGSLVNVEIQKIGIAFPGERAACYSADLLLREYRRLRDKKKKNFSYSDIMPVYTIVIFEESPKELRKAAGYYIHKSNTVFDTGIKVNLLQKYIFISLDNFRNIMQNRVEIVKSDAIQNDYTDDKGIGSSDTGLLHNRLEEWLMFLSFDEPEYIDMIISHNPYFRELYEDIYDMCLNTEGLINMYSKELAELDHNTVIYMIDELKAEVDSQKAELDNKQAEIDSQKAEIDNQKTELKNKDNTIAELTRQLEDLKAQKQ